MIKKKCEHCKKEFEVPDYIEKYKARRFCSKKCADKIYLFKKGHSVSDLVKEKVSKANKGRIPWMKGLTKETDKRLKRMGEMIAGENHPRWKGGRIKSKRGYVIAYAPSHPFAKYKNGAYLLEHRLIYEEYLRRNDPRSKFLIKLGDQLYLRQECVVHHKNGVLWDNRPANLKGYENNKEHLGDGKHVELVCRVCGRKYDTLKSKIKGKRGKYCSRECFNTRGHNK